MTAVKEMTKTKKINNMSLAEVRAQLVKFRLEGKVSPGERARLGKKMKEIMGQLAKLGQKGGRFGQVQLSKEMRRIANIK